MHQPCSRQKGGEAGSETTEVLPMEAGSDEAQAGVSPVLGQFSDAVKFQKKIVHVMVDGQLCHRRKPPRCG